MFATSRPPGADVTPAGGIGRILVLVWPVGGGIGNVFDSTVGTGMSGLRRPRRPEGVTMTVVVEVEGRLIGGMGKMVVVEKMTLVKTGMDVELGDAVTVSVLVAVEGEAAGAVRDATVGAEVVCVEIDTKTVIVSIVVDIVVVTSTTGSNSEIVEVTVDAVVGSGK